MKTGKPINLVLTDKWGNMGEYIALHKYPSKLSAFYKKYNRGSWEFYITESLAHPFPYIYHYDDFKF